MCLTNGPHPTNAAFAAAPFVALSAYHANRISGGDFVDSSAIENLYGRVGSAQDIDEISLWRHVGLARMRPALASTHQLAVGGGYCYVWRI